MKRRVLLEGILFVAIGIVALHEGLRLAREIDPNYVRDVLGPAKYIIFVGSALIITGIGHVLFNYKKAVGALKVKIDKEVAKQDPMMSRIVFFMVVVFAAYIFLINIFGYLVPTPIFLFLQFRLVGVKSWIANIIITLIVSATLYLVFIKYCSMVFPRGILGI